MDGSVAIESLRKGDVSLSFDAYSTRMPGTKELSIGNARFWAFNGPRVGAEHLVIWRREQDVREQFANRNGLEKFSGEPKIRITRARERKQLTAPVYSWDIPGYKEPDRYWDDAGSKWMYWDSFWLPVQDAKLATSTVAFGDLRGDMLAPELGIEKREASSVFDDVAPQRSRGVSDANPVSSTATTISHKDRAFAVIYQCNVWGSDVSRSGTGSDLWSPEARLATTALDAVVEHFQVRSVLDCGCGDATWVVPFFVARHPEVEYCGVDIVPEVIAENKRRHPHLRFHAIDVAEEPLPKGADLVFSKEALNHMPLQDAVNTIGSFKSTGATYLLTNVHHSSVNEDGRNKTCFTTYVKYDYSLPPFNLERVASIIEYQGPGTSFTLYRL